MLNDNTKLNQMQYAQAAKAAKRLLVNSELTPLAIFAALASNQLALAYAAVQLYEQGRELDVLELVALGAPIDRVVRKAEPHFCDRVSSASSTCCRLEYARDPVQWRKRLEPPPLPSYDISLLELMEQMGQEASVVEH